MSTASTESGHGYDVALDEAAGDDSIQVGDLLDDPRTDAEALCLCSLLWSPTPTARAVTTALTDGDFHRPVYGELFNTIAEQVAAGILHDPASIAAALTQAGRTAGYQGTQLARALTQATMAGSPPEATGHYAIAVASAAYRRGFHTTAAALAQAAEQLPQDQLFEHLVSIGREQRTATDRLHHIQAALS
jgi:replicative DNA helicase